jgi:uncharacterized membrane protein
MVFLLGMRLAIINLAIGIICLLLHLAMKRSKTYQGNYLPLFGAFFLSSGAFLLAVVSVVFLAISMCSLPNTLSGGAFAF